MTEAEWLACDDPQWMLHAVMRKRNYSKRKVPLYCAACCRRLVDLFPAPICLEALTVIEEAADGRVARLREVRSELAPYCGRYGKVVQVVPSEAAAAVRTLFERSGTRAAGAAGRSSDVLALEAARVAGEMPDTLPYKDIEYYWYVPEFEAVRASAGNMQRNILLDIFGNPFRPITFLPEWRTNTVLALAQQMYETRDFSAMPILADALQDSGCDNDDVLNHCRGLGPHVRGCWCVDACLGKS